MMTQMSGGNVSVKGKVVLVPRHEYVSCT